MLLSSSCDAQLVNLSFNERSLPSPWSCADALEFLGEMEELARSDPSMRPRAHVFLALLRSLASAGAFEEALQLKDRLCRDAGGRVWPDDLWQAEELVLEAAVKASKVLTAFGHPHPHTSIVQYCCHSCVPEGLPEASYCGAQGFPMPSRSRCLVSCLLIAGAEGLACGLVNHLFGGTLKQMRTSPCDVLIPKTCYLSQDCPLVFGPSFRFQIDDAEELFSGMVKRLHKSSSTRGFSERGMEVRKDPPSPFPWPLPPSLQDSTL